MSAPVRLAVAGAGLIGKRHVAAIAQCPEADLVAIVDPMPAAADYAAGLGVPYFTDLPALFAANLAEGVILATPNNMHVDGGLACVAAGLPALVEKPLATDLGEARRLVEAGEAAGVPLLTGHHRRHNPLIADAHARIKAGEIGQLVSAHAMFWLAKPDDYFDIPWRREKGAGPVLTNLAHDIDLLRHLVGDVSAVQAAQSSTARGHAVEDSCVVTLEFATGALGTANISDTIPAPWSWEMTSGENPAYPKTDQACYLIGGTEGSLELPAGRVWHHSGKRSWWEPLSSRIAPRSSADPLVLQIGQFARVIRDGEAPLVSAREGLMTLEVIAAIQTAAAEHRRVLL
jgi:predicted dehydrogenase